MPPLSESGWLEVGGELGEPREFGDTFSFSLFLYFFICLYLSIHAFTYIMKHTLQENTYAAAIKRSFLSPELFPKATTLISVASMNACLALSELFLNDHKNHDNTLGTFDHCNPLY